MASKKVLITNNEISQNAINLLSSKFETIMNTVHTKDAIIEKIRGVNAAFWATKVRLDKDIIEAAGPSLEIVATMSAGTDHIDVEELKRRGIKLSNTPIVLNAAVAEIAVLLLIAAARRMREGRLHIENGTWILGNQWMLGQDIGGSTVGIVGLGQIGQTIVKRLKVFEVHRFVYTGHREKQEGKDLKAEFVTFDDLLMVSDFVIVSCSLNEETRGMFNESAFSKMKKTAIFVNVARGEIVDQPALIKALKQGTIFAAGLDVMVPEPLPKDHELVKIPNCVLMPHLGSATIRTRNDMAELAAKNIVMGLGGGQLFSPVY